MNNYLDRDITIYESATRSSRGRKGTVAEFLLLGVEHKKRIEAIRAAADYLEAVKTSTDDEKAVKTAKDRLAKLKATTLYGATISGYFPEERHDDAPFTHSGLICIDIDHCDPTQVMEQLRTMDCVLYASRSASGKGVFAIIPLAFPDRHKEQFCALSLMFRQMGIILDEAPKSIASLRFMSFDPQAFLRPNAVEFKGTLADMEPKKESTGDLFKGVPKTETPKQRTNATSTRIDPNSNEYKSALRRAKVCVQHIEQNGIPVQLDYADWIYSVGMPLASLGEEGRDLFRRLSQLDSQKFDWQECDRKFTNLLHTNRNVGIGSFFQWCKHMGVNAKEIEQHNEIADIIIEIEEQEQEAQPQTSTNGMSLKEWKEKYNGAM